MAFDFSIIVPAYNTAPYIEPCLDSIKAAAVYSGKMVEVICIDDGSTDGTANVLDSYGNSTELKNFVLKVIHKENSGVGSARNCGLEVASGEWILFVDSDDMLRESALSDIAKAVERCQDVDFVVFEGVRFKGGDIPDWSDVNETVPRNEDLSKSISDSLFRCLCVLAYRATVLKGVRFKEYVLGEDLLFVCEVIAKARKCHFLGKAEYANRLRQGSATRSAETYRKICDRISYHESMVKVLFESEKKLGRGFTHGHGNSWIESIPSLILDWEDRKERAALFAQWCISMRLVASMPFFSRWQRFVTWMISRTRSVFVARLLCVIPYRLKCKGLHR